MRIGSPPLPVLALGLTLAGQFSLAGRANPWLGVLLLGGGGALIAAAALRAPPIPVPAPIAAEVGPAGAPGQQPCGSEPRSVGLVGGPLGLIMLVLVTIVAGAF